MTVLAVIVAESVPNFDLVMSIIGGTLTSPLVYILPPLIYIKILTLHPNCQENLEAISSTNVVSNNKCAMNGISKYRESISENPVKLGQTNIYIGYAEMGFCLILIVFFFLLTISSTYLNWINIRTSYSSNTTPCMYNLTIALMYL